MPPSYQDPHLQFLWQPVRDLRASADFYREVLGFSVQDGTGSFAVVHLAPAQLYRALHIDALQKRLSARQIHLPAPSDAGWARSPELNDPDGYHLILLQKQSATTP